MAQTQKSYGDWIEAPKIGVKVHVKDGAILNLATGKAVPTFRNKQVGGTISVVLPKNDGDQPGLGKGRFQQIGRVVLAVIQKGSPGANPRKIYAVPKDGHKWNIAPHNLEWVTISDRTQRRIVEGGLRKLDAYTVLTLKDVVTRLAKENIKDYDAIGSVFGIGASHVNNIMTGKSWWYVNKFIKEITSSASNSRLYRAREAAAEFAVYDTELTNYLVSYETAS
jgi:hypothetical protein